MDTQTNDKELNEQIQERFKELPKVVQDAITSADVEKRMRVLADTHKLHLDQWQSLENEVMLALLGFQPVEDLQSNIKAEVGMTEEEAAALAADISKIVFEPIRGELERQLEHPEAKAEELTATESARKEILASETVTSAPVASSPVTVSVPIGTPVVPPIPQLSTPIASGPNAVAPASATPAPAAVPPTTSPAPEPAKAARAPISETYKPGVASSERKDVHSDPYREPPA